MIGDSMNTIYKIQDLDKQILQIKRNVKNSIEYKQLTTLSNIMRDGKTFIGQTENNAENLLKEYQQIKANFDRNYAKSEIIKKNDILKSTVDNIKDFINNSNTLATEFAVLEQETKIMTEKILRLLGDYKNAMSKLKITKEKYNVLKDKVAELEKACEPQIQALNEKIKELEKGVNPEIYAKYRKLKDDNIFPVFVNLENNRCGGCKMELSLNFIENLKQKKMLPCEECRRIIVLDK